MSFGASGQKKPSPDECSYLQEQLTSVPNRTYLWVSLTLDVVENMTGFTSGNIRQAIQNLPPTVDSAYGRILDRSPDRIKPGDYYKLSLLKDLERTCSMWFRSTTARIWSHIGCVIVVTENTAIAY